jgi:CcmD family protein
MFDNLWYLVAAFAVVWVGVFGYLVSVSLLARGVRREVETLAEVIAGSSSVSADPTSTKDLGEEASVPPQTLVREERPQ